MSRSDALGTPGRMAGQRDFGNQAVVFVFPNQQRDAAEAREIRPPLRKTKVHTERNVGALPELTHGFQPTMDFCATGQCSHGRHTEFQSFDILLPFLPYSTSVSVN